MGKARQVAKNSYLQLRKYAPGLMDGLCAVWKGIEGPRESLGDMEDFVRQVRANHAAIQVTESYASVMNRKPSREADLCHLDIAFLVPEPIRGSGGHRNIYRAVSQLRAFGHHLTVYYMQTQRPAAEVKQQVSTWFYDMGDIPFLCYEGELGYHDVAVATWWETVYLIEENREKVRYPFYFTQDFEAYFYPMSTDYILAENTYRMGYPCICSGPWMSTLIREKYHGNAAHFQFPVDRSIYHTELPRTKKNPNVVFFAKPDMPRRCYALGIQALKEFHTLRPEVEIILFGSERIEGKNLPFPATVKKLLPTLNDLADLYRNADLGMVFSTTNPSLVPYEMLSCGCPVVDLDLEFAEAKYGNSRENVFLLSPIPNQMGMQMAALFDTPQELRDCAARGKAWVADEFPSEEEMARRVEELILRNIKGQAKQ